MNLFQVDAGKRMGQLRMKVTVTVANKSSRKGKGTKLCTKPIGIESLKTTTVTNGSFQAYKQ
jgi:hypothetical protein